MTLRDILGEWRKHDEWADVPEGFVRSPDQVAYLCLAVLATYFDEDIEWPQELSDELADAVESERADRGTTETGDAE